MHIRKYSSALKRHEQLIHATRDFSDGQVVKNPPSNAGDADSVSGWEARIPLAMGLLSPCTTQLLSLSAPDPNATAREAQSLQLRPNTAKK